VLLRGDEDEMREGRGEKRKTTRERLIAIMIKEDSRKQIDHAR